MILSLEQIKQITHGAVEVSREQDGLIQLYRMSASQRQIYAPQGELFYKRSCNASGIKLVLETDSRYLTLDVNLSYCTTREFFSMDVYVNDRMIGCIEGHGHDTMFGDYRKTFDLGEGTKAVSVYFPWSMLCGIRSVELDDEASFSPVPRTKKILMYGDSITQGFDSLRPSMCYAARIADWLGAECYNKAIGADVFNPALVESPEPITPDYITVAYGTNDWNKTTRDVFVKNSNLFISRLSTHYPQAKLFVLAPIWRKAWQEEREFGLFEDIGRELQAVCQKIPNAIYINCFGFIPQDESCFQDRVLHPNDLGFDHYFHNLCRAMQPYI